MESYYLTRYIRGCHDSRYLREIQFVGVLSGRRSGYLSGGPAIPAHRVGCRLRDLVGPVL